METGFEQLYALYREQREQCRLLDGRIAYCQSSYDHMRQCGGYSQRLLSRTVQRRLMQLQQNCTEQTVALQLTESRLRQLFQTLPRQVMRDVLEYRYIGELRWLEVARLVDLDPRHAMRLSTEARRLLEPAVS